jgi:TPP-dependent pyruvate/acetoin dehydrogenase alpha subunit
MLGLYEFMLLNRGVDERLRRLYRLGEIPGGVFLSLGQEAVSVGSAMALGPEDVVGPMIRNMGAYLVRGVAPEAVFANALGRATGPTGGRDGNTHFGDLRRGIIAPVSMLAASIPVCAGAALAFKMRGERRVALTYIGDGGSSVGDFHEGLNFAAVQDLPLVLILENNGWAYSTPVSRQTRARRFVDRAAGYGIPGVRVDGNDAVAVYETTRRAVARARRGEGPTLIEAVTMRMCGHAEHDDASYVPREELERWARRDPIRRHERRLLREGIAGREELEAIRRRVDRRLDEALEAARRAPWPDPATLTRGLFAGGAQG